MTQFERRVRDLVNPLTRWWSNSATRKAWQRRAAERPRGESRKARDFSDLRNSETARRAQEAVRDLRKSDAARRAQGAVRDFRNSETARKTQEAVRDLRDSETARRAQASVRDLRDSDAGRRAQAAVQDAEAAVRSAYLRIRRSAGRRPGD